MTLFISSNTTTTSAHDPADMERITADAPVAALAGLTSWLRCDFGVSGDGDGTEGSGGGIEWLSMLGPARLTAMADTGPDLIASAFNSRPCLRFNSSGRNGRLYDAGANDLWPASASVTLVYVAKSNTGANTEIIGTDKATGYAMIQHASGGGIRVQHVNPTSLITTSAPGDTNPHVGIYSYDYSTHEWDFRINGVSKGTGTAVSEVAAANLTVGGADSNGSFRGDFYELLTFSRPMHRAEDEADLAALEGYLSALYGIF